MLRGDVAAGFQYGRNHLVENPAFNLFSLWEGGIGYKSDNVAFGDEFCALCSSHRIYEVAKCDPICFTMDKHIHVMANIVNENIHKQQL